MIKNKFKFKGQEITPKKFKNNIKRFYDIADKKDLEDGKIWYDEAHSFAKELSNRFGVSVEQSCGIIAALSPQTSWTINKTFAIEFLKSPSSNKIGTHDRRTKCRKILSLKSESDIYNALSSRENGALKTKAFFKNILLPNKETLTTIDRHAIASCIQRPEQTEALDNNMAKITIKQYNIIQECYKDVAKSTNVLSHQLQAIIWIVYRRQRNLFQHKEVSLEWQGMDNFEGF